MLSIKKVWRYINALFFWVLDAWRLWATRSILVVLVVIIIGSQLPGIPGDRVRYCGLAFQLLGIITVVFGLRDRRRLFNRPRLDDVRGWLGRIPRWNPQTISFSATGGLCLSGSGNPSFWRGVSPDASIEDRLAALLANVESLKTEQAETAKELQEEKRKRLEAVDSERRMRESAIIDIRTQLDKLGAGGLHLEWAGVIWLILGVILATIPSEIADALKWF